MSTSTPPDDRRRSPFPIDPPIEPMLAKLADELPDDGNALFEPKWDGFRAIVFRGGTEVFIQSRDSGRSIATFPSCTSCSSSVCRRTASSTARSSSPPSSALDFDALQLRLHPAASRVAKLAAETPSSFVAFDLLAVDGRDLRDEPQASAPRCARSACSRTSSRRSI